MPEPLELLDHTGPDSILAVLVDEKGRSDEHRISEADSGDHLEALVDPSGTTIFKVIGELDLSSVGPIRDAIEAIVTTQPDRILFDLAELRLMDCSGLRMFLAVAEKVAEVHLLNPSPIVRKVIEVTGTSDAFTITP